MTKTLTEQWREGTLGNSYSQYSDLDKPEGYLWLTDENKKLQQQVERLQEQLEIATKALKKTIRDYEINGIGYLCVTRAKKALKEIEEVK